ncbi:MAG: hypothetical protein Q4F11_08015 [Eubacteriales bacterium]|nr:hypothetical protein [Eubacteriales bacterium]
MGLFGKIKRRYEDEFELENLDDLVYYDEDIEPVYEEKKETSGRAKDIKQQMEDSKKEEEKYDHLLNSVQAQNLIKTVDKINGSMKKPKKLETVKLDDFKGQDIENYVREQCDIMESAAAYMEAAKEKYEAVTEHLSDIQAIEEAPENIREAVKTAAQQVDLLTIDRRIFKSAEQKLSNNAYYNVERYEDEIPNGIKYLEKQEAFFEAVKRDMRMVEGERLGLRMESKQLVNRQLRIKNMAMWFIFCMVAVYIVFMIALFAADNDENMAVLLLVTSLAAILALSMFAVLKATERQVLVMEMKLNKATLLLNKIKIKYVNAANTLDYEYNKYHVKNSYELAKKYEAYIQMKEEQTKAVCLTSSLNEAELNLEKVLGQAGLYDTHVWLGQVRALIYPKEMVEVRHELNVQRQKLRNQIEYNESRIGEAKDNIKKMTLRNPEYSTYALRIIEMYEQKNKSNRS